MKKIINDSNEIDIYVGSNGLYFDPENKNLSYLSSITSQDLDGLEDELSKKKATQIILGKNYDCYPAIEADNNYVRDVLVLIDKYKHGVTIYTKSKLILRDLDLLKSIATHSKVVLMLQMNTTNEVDSQNINGVSFVDKLRILEEIKSYDIEIGFNVCPILPYISDDINNMDELISLAIKYNASYFLYRGASVIINNKYKEAVYHVLDDHYFGLRSKYDSIRQESYVIESPKINMLENYIKDLVSGTNMIYVTHEIIKKAHSYQRKHKQMSIFDDENIENA